MGTEIQTPFIDIEAAAKFLCVSPKTIYGWIHDKEKKFPVRHHGRRVVFLTEELKRWSDEQNGRTEKAS